jgi:hypothetical protein
VLYAHVYALLYAGVVLPDERNPRRERGKRSVALAGAYKRYNARIPGHGVEPAVRTRTLVTGQN